MRLWLIIWLFSDFSFASGVETNLCAERVVEQLETSTIHAVDTPLYGSIDGGLVVPSADGRLIWVPLSDGKVVGLNQSDHSTAYQFQLGSVQPVSSLSVCADGKHVAAGNRFGEVGIWSLASQKSVLRLEEPVSEALTGGIESLAFSSSGRFLAASRNDGDLALYERFGTEWKLVAVYPLSEDAADEASKVVFLPQTEILAVALSNGKIILLDAESGNRRAVLGQAEAPLLAGMRNRTLQLKLSPSGSFLFVSIEQLPKTGARRFVPSNLAHRFRKYETVATKAGLSTSFFELGGTGGTIKLVRTLMQAGPRSELGRAPVAIFKADETKLAKPEDLKLKGWMGEFVAHATPDGHILISEIGTWKTMGVLRPDLGAVSSLAFSGGLLVSAHASGKACFWDLVNGTQHWLVTRQNIGFDWLQFMPGGLLAEQRKIGDARTHGFTRFPGPTLPNVSSN